MEFGPKTARHCKAAVGRRITPYSWSDAVGVCFLPFVRRPTHFLNVHAVYISCRLLQRGAAMPAISWFAGIAVSRLNGRLWAVKQLEA